MATEFAFEVCKAWRHLLSQVHLSDISSRTALFTVGGPAGGRTLAAVGAASAEGMRAGQHEMMMWSGSPVILAAGALVASPDWTLIVDEGAAAELWHSLTANVPLLPHPSHGLGMDVHSRAVCCSTVAWNLATGC